jgi:hypothetical protein
VRNAKRGRAHLEKLLGNAETVVRLTPADLIVLTGVENESIEGMGELLDLLREQGVEVRGMVILGPGMGIDSIDVDELIRLDALADQVDEGQPVSGETSMDALTLSVKCPRCLEVLEMSITASIQDNGQRLVGGTTVDGRDLELHSMVCTGTKLTSE